MKEDQEGQANEERTIDVHMVIGAGKVQQLVATENAPQQVVALEKVALPPHRAKHFKAEVLREMLYSQEFKAKKFEQWYQARLPDRVI